VLTRSDLISRARERGVADGKPPVAARVDFVTELMEELQWDSRYLPWLAELWGIAEATMHGHTSEASRRVTGDAESARRDITAGARKLYRQAVEDGKAKDARAIGELWATVAGAKAPERHEVLAATGEVTPEMAARLVRESFGEKARPNADRDTKPDDPGEVPVEPTKP
jgi:hypothetical protein